MSQTVVAKAVAQELPDRWYYDPKSFEQERQTIWYRSWLFVGSQEQLANPGDYLCYTIGNEPILVIRTPSGKLQAMYNSCSHRAMPLVEGHGNCKQLRCPYHAWTYNLEGQLQSVTYEECFPDLDKSTIALPKIQVDTWGDFIFVNLDPEAGSLKDYLAGVPEFLGQYPHPWSSLRLSHRITRELPANWKLMMEISLDPYHVLAVHPQILGLYDLPGGFYNSTSGLHSLQVLGSKGPEEPSYTVCLFPNVLLVTLEELLVMWQMNAITPEYTVIEKFFYQTPEQMEKFPLNSDPVAAERSRVLFEQDKSVVCRLQQQVKSRFYKRPQLLSPALDDGVITFRQAVMSVMNAPIAHSHI